MKITQIMGPSALLLALAMPQQPTRQPQEHPTRTRVVLLGTGTPVPDPDRSGPATAIVVDDRAYLVDFGPGVVRRAESAALSRAMPAVEPGNLKVAFVTHLHSDHTAGYADLIFTGWTSGRTVPLQVYGPSGLESMTEQLAALAVKAKPKLLVIYHTVSFPPGIAPPRLLPPQGGAGALYAPPEMIQSEIGSRYSGKFVIGKDLDVY